MRNPNASPSHAAMIAARTALLFDSPMWGMLALRLELVADPRCRTAYTDGIRIGYNPEYVLSLSNAERKGLIVEEVEHVARGHCWRRDGRDARDWNKACDAAIFADLEREGFAIPEHCFKLPEHAGKSPEFIYSRIAGLETGEQDAASPEADPDADDSSGAEQDGPAGIGVASDDPDATGDGDETGEPEPGNDSGAPAQDGEEQDAPGNSGTGNTDPDALPDPDLDVRDYPADADTPAELAEQEWKQAVISAASYARGTGGSVGERTLAAATETRVDWRALLRRFLAESSNADYSWRAPNRRYAAHGLYLPTLRSDALGKLGVAIDVSGSLDDISLGKFVAEVESILAEFRPASLEVVWCDERVTRRETFEHGDAIDWRALGGGGTDFRPIFDAFDSSEDPPLGVIVFTDLDGPLPATPPEYPVLFLSTWRESAPFGEVVPMRE